MTLTIAVTGACGTIGTAIVAKALEDGRAVIALDALPESESKLPTQVVYRQVDLTDYEAFLAATKGADALIHLAATYSLQNPKDPDGPLIRHVPDHIVHNVNTTMSWNALSVAAELGIKRVSLASSVNAIGLIFSKRPRFDYLPLDENHPRYPEDAYSVCKLEVENQCDAFARKYPDMRMATLRPHWVIPETLAYDAEALHEAGGTVKDLWGWVSAGATARAFLQGITAPLETFPLGHETFFVVAPTICQQASSRALLQKHFPEVKDLRREWKGNEGFFDCSKAERMLGWTERGHPWTEGGR